MFVHEFCYTFILLSGFYTVYSECEKSTALKLEEELRKHHEIALYNRTLYDGGDILKWNCTNESDGKNISLPFDTSVTSAEEPAETKASLATIEEPTLTDDPPQLNTYLLVYRKVFKPQVDESAAPSSHVPVHIVSNITSGEKNKTESPETGTITKCNDETSEGPASSQYKSQPSYKVPVNILLGEKHGITILNASNPSTPILLNYTDLDAYGVDYQYSNGIYFTAKGKIKSTGKRTSLVASGADGPVRLAVDWVHNKLYWMSDKHQTLEVVNLDGSDRKLLTDVIPIIKYPNNIAVDPYRSLVFFAANNTLYRMDLDGKNLQMVNLKVDTNKTVRCITLDVQSMRIFFSGWTDIASQKPYIASCNFDGDEVKYHDVGDWNDVYSIDVYRDVLFFAHYNGSSTDSIWLFNTSWTGKRPVHVYDEPKERGGIWSLKVYDSEVQKQRGKLEE